MCLRCGFWKHFKKEFLCNDSRLYKNMYKVFCLLKKCFKVMLWVYKMILLWASEQLGAFYLLKRSLVFFSSSFRCGYLTIVLVRSPIIGCEGTGAGRLYSHRRQPMECFSNVVLETRSFTEGNIEGHRGTTIFYRGSLLKRPCSRDMTICPRQQVRLS